MRPACSLIGKAAFHLNEHQQSELAYRKAVEVNAAALPACKGLAELYTATGNTQGSIQAHQQLVSESGGEGGESCAFYLL